MSIRYSMKSLQQLPNDAFACPLRWFFFASFSFFFVCKSIVPGPLENIHPLSTSKKKKKQQESQSIGRELNGANAQLKANLEHEFWHPVAAVGCGPLIPTRLDSHGLSIGDCRGQLGKASRTSWWPLFHLPYI